MKSIRHKKSLLTPLFISLLFIFQIAPITAGSFESIEEKADTSRPSDSIVIGDMDSYSNSSIILDNFRYSFCRQFVVYSPLNSRLNLNDIDAAVKVKLFINDGCVRKIKVLRFAS